MKEFKYVVTDNEGIHARPAGELVKLVKGFESTISIEKEGKKVDCRKLLALMGLGVKKGHEVTWFRLLLLSEFLRVPALPPVLFQHLRQEP